jgi:hypothetical protein
LDFYFEISGLIPERTEFPIASSYSAWLGKLHTKIIKKYKNLLRNQRHVLY